MKRLQHVLLLILFLGLVASPLSAASSSKIVETITAKQLIPLLAESGVPDTEIDKDGDILVKMHGRKVLLLVGSEDNVNVQFKFSITGTKANFRTTNEWSRKAKFTKSYIDEDGSAVLEMDLDLAGGVTEKRIVDAIKTFNLSLENFLKELGEV